MTDNRDALVKLETITYHTLQALDFPPTAMQLVEAIVADGADRRDTQRVVQRLLDRGVIVLGAGLRLSLATQVQTAAPVLTETGVRFKVGEVLPCPFCGSDKLAQAFTRATDTFAFWSVECMGCGVEVADDESQEAANRAWNTRSALAQPPAAAEAVEREGWVLVPRVPTQAMVEAGEIAAWDDANHMPAIRAIPCAYDAMIAAAPTSAGSHE